RIGGYRYAPGSTLVKHYLNPITKARSMRFLNFLKPDFQGGALAALAVDPSVLRLADRALTARMLWQLFGRSIFMATTFAREEEAGAGGPGARSAGAGLLPEEEAALDAPEKPQSFNPEDEKRLGSARIKLARNALGAFAVAQRLVAGRAGEAQFALAPSGP